MYKYHVFICESCQHETSDGLSEPAFGKKMRKNISAMAKEMFPEGDVCISGSGCLGQCERGITSVIYPKGEWIFDLRPGDEEKILKELQKR